MYSPTAHFISFEAEEYLQDRQYISNVSNVMSTIISRDLEKLFAPKYAQPFLVIMKDEEKYEFQIVTYNIVYIYEKF